VTQQKIKVFFCFFLRPDDGAALGQRSLNRAAYLVQKEVLYSFCLFFQHKPPILPHFQPHQNAVMQH
jgi:hypothetical protein